MTIETTDRAFRPENHAAPDPVRAQQADQNVGALLTRLGHDVGDLLTTEVNLAKAELTESMKDMKAGAVSLLTGALVLFAGLLVLLNGLARTLAAFTDMQAWISFLIVGGAFSIIGAILLANSKAKLSADNLALIRTEASLHKDKQVAKEQLP